VPRVGCRRRLGDCHRYRLNFSEGSSRIGPAGFDDWKRSRAAERIEQPPQRIGPRRIRNVFNTAPTRHKGLGRARREFLEQAGLADARFAADQDERTGTAADLVNGRAELTKGAFASDQLRGALAPSHDLSL